MTPQQMRLLEKAHKSLEAARLLSASNLYSFAISRAYYVMFYVAKAMLLSLGMATSKHSGVIALFGQHFGKTGRVATEYHRYLSEGHNKRTISDYDDEVEMTEAEADLQIERAAKFLAMGEAFFNALAAVPPAESPPPSDER